MKFIYDDSKDSNSSNDKTVDVPIITKICDGKKVFFTINKMHIIMGLLAGILAGTPMSVYAVWWSGLILLFPTWIIIYFVLRWFATPEFENENLDITIYDIEPACPLREAYKGDGGVEEFK